MESTLEKCFLFTWFSDFHHAGSPSNNLENKVVILIQPSYVHPSSNKKEEILEVNIAIWKNLIAFKSSVLAYIGCDWDLWETSFIIVALQSMSILVCFPLKPKNAFVVLSCCRTEPSALLYNEKISLTNHVVLFFFCLRGKEVQLVLKVLKVKRSAICASSFV